MEEEGGRILTKQSGCVPKELRCLAEVELCDTDREIELCARGADVFWQRLNCATLTERLSYVPEELTCFGRG